MVVVLEVAGSTPVTRPTLEPISLSDSFGRGAEIRGPLFPGDGIPPCPNQGLSLDESFSLVQLQDSH